jgi:acetolactate synthase I/II/III large subunit
VYVAGVGQHQMWSAQHIPYTRPAVDQLRRARDHGLRRPRRHRREGRRRPRHPVVAIDGDGCFQMTFQEIAAAVQHDIPVVFCVINNGYLGMVRQWQHLFYDDRLSQVALPQDLPDLIKLADAYGIPGFRAETVDELDAVLAEGPAITDQPILIEFRVDPDEMVFPMVPSGASNDEILESVDEWHARARRPDEVDDTPRPGTWRRPGGV